MSSIHEIAYSGPIGNQFKVMRSDDIEIDNDSYQMLPDSNDEDIDNDIDNDVDAV